MLYNQFMSLTPPVNRILLYLYLAITLVVGASALIWPSVRSFSYAPLRDLLFPNMYLPTQAGMPVTLTVAAPVALEEWLKTSASDFSRQNSLIQIEVIPVRGMEADRRLNTIASQPDVWIAEAEFVRSLAGSVPYETRGSPLAQDTFIWVAGKNQTGLSGKLDWSAISQASAANPQFRVAMPPLNSVEGMAACWSAAGSYHQRKDLGAAQINDPAFRKWLSELALAAPDRNKAAYDQLATRPPQVDVGLIQSSELEQLAQGSFFSQPPEYNPAFNYPFFIRSNWQNTLPDEAAARQSAAASFRDYLLSSGPQAKLSGYNLQPARAITTGQVPALDDSTVRALRFCWQ